MLKMKPACEHCSRELSVTGMAYICSYECTFCQDCVEGVLKGVCPNCNGDLVQRPTRKLPTDKNAS